jgi:hypothetical protein
MPVVEPVAVANVEPLLAAIPPHRELHEPRENGREGRIERTSVDLPGSTGNNLGAAAWPVVGMGSLESGQDPSPVQKIVDQGLDRIRCTPTSSHLGRTSAAPIRMSDKAIASTLSETP